MPDSALDLEEQVARIRRTQAEIDNAQEETRKFVAEQHKLMAEGGKLVAEQHKLMAEGGKFRREPWVALVTGGAALVAAGAALGGLLIKAYGG